MNTTKSVGLFSLDELGKFIRQEDKLTSSRVVPVWVWREAVAYLLSRYPKTRLTVIGFQHHAFLFYKTKHGFTDQSENPVGIENNHAKIVAKRNIKNGMSATPLN